MKNLMIAISLFTLIMAGGCKSKAAAQQKQNTEEREIEKKEERRSQGQRKGPPSVDEVFKMDVNNDGKLSKSEVKGPLQRDFSIFDLDGDGFITKAEFAKAPKPKKGQGPQRNN